VLPSTLVPSPKPPTGAPAATTRYVSVIVGAGLGIIAALTSGAGDPIEVGALAATFAVLALASVVDLEERRIPNRLTYPAMGTALLVAVLLGDAGASVMGLAAAGGFMLLAAVVGGDQLGMGDVKLSAFAGTVVGVHGVPLFLLAGTTVGALLAGALLIRQRDRRATLPYGPCLSLGAAIAALNGTVLS
jgi:leader peptidase (prepilin peptidase)/N-methyltransferase